MRRIVALIFVSLTLGACSHKLEYAPAPAQAMPGSVNINTATADELEGLPHIGRKTAESIVAFREQNGPFRRAEQLLLIRGMSESRFAELRSMVRVE